MNDINAKTSMQGDNPVSRMFGKRCSHQMLTSCPASILNHKSFKQGIPRYDQPVNGSSS